MADKIASASKSEESSAERRRSSRRPSPHCSPRTMPVAQRERSTSSVKGTRSFRRGTANSSVRKPMSWELILPSEGWMCDADDEKEVGGTDPSEKGESSEEDPEMEEEYPEEAGNPEDRVPATPSLPMDIDAEEDFQRYVEELGRAPEPSPLHSSQASVPDEPVEVADRQSASHDGSSYDVSGVWPPRSLSPSAVHGVENWGVTLNESKFKACSGLLHKLHNNRAKTGCANRVWDLGKSFMNHHFWEVTHCIGAFRSLNPLGPTKFKHWWGFKDEFKHKPQ
ncbi:hypothetical protein PIB30_065602 [Stylosanthes scabra]|uniref:Uncharacterized protein n=1 Tax=Stylosanthes scabra TaxID=79078 RepID=A0ABU6RMW8_9FABA|nr:hypothetical protein [Stylosanthes scabra]